MNRALITAAAFLITVFASTSASAGAFPGGVYSWRLPAGAENVRFAKKPVMIVNGTALVGLGLSQAVGEADLTYTVNGEEQTHTFAVSGKSYTEQHLEIANRAMVNPPAETLERISEESRRQRRLYASFAETPDALVEGEAAGFMQPLQGIITSLFGHRRFFNGQPRRPHSGLDIAAETGTPVASAGAGVVTLADDLYFNGNTVFVDHGQGLVTMYCHLSETTVAVGDRVEQGDIIGLVGATGRVTGAHLHWTVSLNGNRVDPPTFLTTLNAALALAE